MLSSACYAGLLLLVASAEALPREHVLQHVVRAQANPLDVFTEWAVEHGKQYVGSATEFANRFRIWKDNLDFITTYNQKHSSHWLGLNVHADETHEEFQTRQFGFDYAAHQARRRAQPLQATPFRYADVDVAKLPMAVDWRKRGAVSHVKNQQQCGSCWAFSATGAIEGANAIYTGELEVLSEQELVDCDLRKDHGCSGGLMDTAFEFVIDNGGLDTERDYKYHAVQGECDLKRRDRHVVTIDSYEDVPPQDAVALLKAAAHQPVAIAIQANERPFQLYAGGVFTDDCGTQLDHGVLLAGYGRENGTDYWLVKNSWGPAWGDNGYIKIQRDMTPGPGRCGITLIASYPVKETPNPPRPPRPSPDPPAPPSPSPTPPPSPEPVKCDSVTQCSAGTTCCCMQDLLSLCLQWACCPIPKATCCDDKVHCCPSKLPVCDVEHGRCLPDGVVPAYAGSFMGEPWLQKVPAQRTWGRSQTLVQHA